MSKDDLCFVWNCCDELEEAKERETVLRIIEKLRKRFEVKTEPSGAVGLLDLCPMPAPESGVGFERVDLNTPDGSGDFERE